MTFRANRLDDVEWFSREARERSRELERERDASYVVRALEAYCYGRFEPGRELGLEEVVEALGGVAEEADREGHLGTASKLRSIRARYAERIRERDVGGVS